jgi:hypothetical protein
MFVRDNINQFSKSGADVQFFYQDGVWTKPPGVGMIYMLLIGGGGLGTGTNGGASGSVTRWFGNANHVPDSLVIHPSTGNANNTTVSYRGTTTSTLLTANAANTNTAGTVMTANEFANLGHFNSIAGTTGVSSTTFVTAGGTTATSNIGYASGSTANGLFVLQPMITSTGSTGTSTASTRMGGIGSGSHAGNTTTNAGGLVIIASY